MQSLSVLKNKLKAIDEKDYGAYQSLLGEYDYKEFKLVITQIPKDPYAPPHTGIYRLQLKFDYIGIPKDIIDSKIKNIAFRDFLARNIFHVTAQISKGRRGTGYSGIITIAEPGQAILERSSVIVSNEDIEVRFFIGLPANGRLINAKLADEMLFTELPDIVNRSLSRDFFDAKNLDEHLKSSEDTEFLREQLKALGLVSFIADGAILPRKSGVCDSPMDKEIAVRFCSPESLKVEIKLPHAGTVRGMGIPFGVTLIVGGGYHGKSTLLEAIKWGIYNHIPGDGREKCVSLLKTVKIRSYSGRNVEKVDISTFIKNLPLKNDTTAFSTENASGSTSQAASIIEAAQAGAEVLLMDEDTCATNFMIRDQKMQRLVQKNDEPITTFIDKARQFYSERNISTILVLGGAGDYFDISDNVIQMIKYLPIDVTSKARTISEESPVKRKKEDNNYSIIARERIPLTGSIDPFNDYNKLSVYAKEVNRINFGKTIIDLTDVEQIIEISQTKAIGQALIYMQKYIDGKTALSEIVSMLMHDIDEEGLDILNERISGNFALFREIELICALNRLRTLKIEQRK